ncbi:fimbrial protein [Dyella sp.]|uniref:fimbrial protein n=1 Tax=Dyella sp. TaxID=1869338 RepID=UPI002ED51DC9
MMCSRPDQFNSKKTSGLACGGYKLLYWLLIMAASVIAPAVAHATCKYVDSTSLNLSAVLQGSVTVGRDIPLGTEIYRTQVTSSGRVVSVCDAESTYNYRYISLPRPKSSFVSDLFGANIYDTNIPGIGVVVWAGTYKPVPVSFNTVPANNTIVVLYHSFYVSLIKTANNVDAGTITGAGLPTFEYVVGSNNLRVHYGNVTGSLNVVSRTCTTPNVTVDMGDHGLFELKGVGSTTASVDASFQLNDCPAFFGRPSIRWNNGSISQGELGANSVSFRIDPTSKIVDAARGVFALKSGGATGIGLQLLDGSANPISFGAFRPSGLSLQQTEGTNYRIPLQARYYQTDTEITPGQADGSVTITLSYQ